MRYPLSLLVLCCLFFTGCLPESKNPLSLPSDSRIDGRLEGVYAQRNKDAREDAGYWHFHYRGVKTGEQTHSTTKLEILSVEPAKDGGLNTHRYEALAVRLGGRDYFSFVDFPDEGAKRKKALPYSFARYELNWRGDLRVWIADNMAFAAAIKAGQLRGTVISGKFGATVKITDTTAHLAAFVAASDPKVLFSAEPLVMRRIAR